MVCFCFCNQYTHNSYYSNKHCGYGFNSPYSFVSNWSVMDGNGNFVYITYWISNMFKFLPTRSLVSMFMFLILFVGQTNHCSDILNMIWIFTFKAHKRDRSVKTNFIHDKLSNDEQNWLKLITIYQKNPVFVFEIYWWTRVRTFYVFLVILTRRTQSRGLINKWLKSDKNWISNQYFSSKNSKFEYREVRFSPSGKQSYLMP